MNKYIVIILKFWFIFIIYGVMRINTLNTRMFEHFKNINVFSALHV